MQLFKVNKNIEVVCEAKSTRNGFKHVATLLYKGREYEAVKINYLNRTWERYTFESVLYKLAEKTTALTDRERKAFTKFIKTKGGRGESENLKTVALIAGLGEVFGKDQKQKNDWKARMLKAGLGGSGLIMPDDWDSLDEQEKEKRLNLAISELKK